MAKQFDSVFIWDIGPPPAVEPLEPLLPAGFEEDHEMARAREMVRYKYVLEAYDEAYKGYLKEKKEVAEFGGRPKHLRMSHVEAAEAMSRDPRRYMKVLP